MRRTVIAAASLALAFAATLTPGRPALAQVGGGSLSITQPGLAAAVGTAAPATTSMLDLGATTVTDSRAVASGWLVTATATDLTRTGSTIPKTNLSWTTGSITATVGSLNGVTSGVGGPMATSVVVAQAALLAGTGSYEYGATVTVLVPPNVTAGTYSGQLVQTVS